MSGLRSTLVLCGLLMMISSRCDAQIVQVENCAEIESCFQYFEGPCTSDGKRQVCLAFNDIGGTCTAIRADAPGTPRTIRMCLQNNFIQENRMSGEFLCQQGDDLVRGGDFYSFGLISLFDTPNTDSRQVTITNYPNGKADCMGYTDACAASGNNDFTLRFRVSPCPNATTTTAAITTTATPCNCTPWANFGPCSQPCGPGLQEQRRTCMGCNPIPLTTRFVPCNLGACTTTPTSTTTAMTTPAPVDGMWGPWGPFGACSATCGGGTRTRTRTCNNPPPSNGGMPCVPPMQGQQICNPQTCPPVDCRAAAILDQCAGLSRRALRRCLRRECGRRG